ncbi:MAG: YneF family protein [Bacilli bacterium]|jgi:uncharacterized protein YneF (UPF0154 family)
MTLPIWAFVVIVVLCLVGGLLGGFFIARALVKKELKDNPPITRDMLKAMYKSMGRTPSEAQLNQSMRAISDAQKKSQKK